MLGQQNDARMNVALALTAAKHGATIANHCEVVKLIKNEHGHIKGTKVRDNLTGDEFDVKAKVGNQKTLNRMHTRYILITCPYRVSLMLLVPLQMVSVKWMMKKLKKLLHHLLVFISSYQTTIVLVIWDYLILLQVMAV